MGDYYARIFGAALMTMLGIGIIVGLGIAALFIWGIPFIAHHVSIH